MSVKSEQSRRIVYMLQEFIKGRAFTAADLRQELSEQTGPVSLRTIQRDLRLLQECEPSLEQIKDGREVYWKIPRSHLQIKALRLDSRELLSFHILKAQLKAFNGTIIEEDVRRLSRKLEDLAPGEAFAEEGFFWDQNFGMYDYSGHSEIINKLIPLIVRARWAEIDYERPARGSNRKLLLMPRKLFVFSGALYLAAYIAKHKNDITLSVHNILDVTEAGSQNRDYPDFDPKKFRRERFGVYSDQVRKIRLLIDNNYAHHFANRSWHPTQKILQHDNGNLVLKMQSPVTPELLSWIAGWHEAITVLRPDDLIERVKEIHQKALNNYL